MLSDFEIVELAQASQATPQPLVTPFDANLVQPNSLDVRLDRRFLLPTYNGVMDLANVPTGHMAPLDTNQLVMQPGDFVLGATKEFFRIPSDLVARVEGKSSLARLGLVVHTTAGFIDSGFEGHITLEFVNHAPWPVLLHAGMTIAQVCFAPCSSVERPYQGRYQGAPGPQESRYNGVPR